MFNKTVSKINILDLLKVLQDGARMKDGTSRSFNFQLSNLRFVHSFCQMLCCSFVNIPVPAKTWIFKCSNVRLLAVFLQQDISLPLHPLLLRQASPAAHHFPVSPCLKSPHSPLLSSFCAIAYQMANALGNFSQG